MAIPNSAFVLLYASMAHAPERAMNMAARMAATAFESCDLPAVQRWSDCYVELQSVFENNDDSLLN